MEYKEDDSKGVERLMYEIECGNFINHVLTFVKYDIFCHTDLGIDGDKLETIRKAANILNDIIDRYDAKKKSGH